MSELSIGPGLSEDCWSVESIPAQSPTYLCHLEYHLHWWQEKVFIKNDRLQVKYYLKCKM
jgi:hypothetical protein